MMAMSRWMQRRWCARTGRKAWGAVRLLAALWMAFYIAYTPIHLYLEPHSDGGDATTGTASARSGDRVADDRHHGDDHPGRHQAEQHKLKATQPARAAVVELMPVQAVEWLDSHQDPPQPLLVEHSGLSPPGFSCRWQFIFRAALPVRAPSFVS
jgi:hypothetical protein